MKITECEISRFEVTGQQLPPTELNQPLMKQEFFDPDLVNDRDSFMKFAQWLIADRQEADDAERTDPERYKWGGARGWQNSSIASFLEGSIAGADAQRDWAVGDGPSWKDLAVFLYLGKIYE